MFRFKFLPQAHSLWRFLWAALPLSVLPLTAQENAAPLAGQKYLQEYVIERNDLLSITFWQQPSLNTQARVADDGAINLPMIGQVHAAGYTITTLEQEIIRQFSFYNAKITQASVAILEFGSKAVYISGQVTTPGKYTFAAMPTIWQALLEAGGPLETANLDQVTMVRGSGEEAGKVMTVDVADALSRQAIDDLPKVAPGDIVYVPAVAVSETIARRSPLQKSVLIYIYGAVTRPGPYQYEMNTNVMQAVINAGGPTPDADIEHVRVVGMDSVNTQLAVIDFNRYNREPHNPPIILKPGDTVYLPRRRSFFASGNSVLVETYRIGLTALASYLILNATR
jgi:protein involved in polysaccharide export with SLBB domain